MESEIFRVLADPTRRAVFEKLAAGERSVGVLTKDFAVSQPAISQHLAQLRKAGLVSERREGRNTYYAATPVALDPLVAWIDRYRTFWPDKIERLKTVLKGMDQ